MLSWLIYGCAVLVLIGSSIAHAQDMHPPMAMDGPPHGPDPMGPDPMGPGHPPPFGPLAALANAEADQVAADAIATLANAPADDVRRIVRALGVPAALRWYDVPPKAFHDALTPRLVAVVRAAAHDGRISGADADRIADQLQHAPPPPMPRP